jgi:hypothetical protein
MCVKKWICCAILLYICYLIVNYLDKPVESFGGGGGGFGRGGFGRGGFGRGGFGRGGFGGFGRGGYYGGFGRGGYYGGRVSYPVVVTQDYYPSYWYRYIPFFGY